MEIKYGLIEFCIFLFQYQYIIDKQTLEKKIGVVENKITDMSDLVTTAVLKTKNGVVDNEIPGVRDFVPKAVLNKKIGEVENKISDVSSLVKKTDYNAKVSEIEGKYFTTFDYNKFIIGILDEEVKQKS